MKKSGMTIVFVIICIGALVAAYGVGVCIREIRFSRTQVEPEVTVEADKPGSESQPEGVEQKPTPPDEGQEPEDRSALATGGSEDGPPRQRMGGPGGAFGTLTKEQLENMSEEERREAFAKMRERFGGRRREGGPQLSEEDRAKFREEMEALSEKWDQMSDEEKQKVEAEFREKYGFFRPPGARGGRGGARRRSRPDDGQ